MEAIVAVALPYSPCVVVLHAMQNAAFSLLLRCEGNHGGGASSDGAPRAGGEIISCWAIVLREVDMAVDSAWSDISSAGVNYLGVFAALEEETQAGDFAIFHADFDTRREDFAGCDLGCVRESQLKPCEG